ncbi:MAG: LCP family glycopolymer transferase [Canibacter sp.]
MSLSAQLQQPLRHPDVRSGPFMTKRARWLVILGFLLPGSAQVLTGKKKLGRFGIGATFFWVLVAIAAGVFLFANRSAALTLFTNTWVLLALQVALIFYAILWLILGLDTLRLTKLKRVEKNWRLPIAILSIILTLVPSLGAAWAANSVGAGRELLSSLFGNNAPAVEPVDGRYNILLLGTDAGSDREGLRPDSISLVSVEAETGQSTIIGLPRELANVPFPEDSPMYNEHPEGFGVIDGCETGRCWLNSVYAEVEYYNPELYPNATDRGSEPGIEATKDAISGATGLEVQFYVLINMDSFEKLIDALGGVTINVEEDLPIGGDEYGYGVEGYVKAGKQKLNGFEALWYARSRYGSDRGDYDRMDRQRELQAAILAQMTPTNVLLRFEDIAKSGSDIAATDIPDSMLGRFVDLAAKAKEFEPVNVQLTPPDVDTEYPDYAHVHELVRAGIAEATPQEEE